LKRKELQLCTFGVILIALMFFGQSGIVNATPKAPVRLLSDTLVGSDPFVEGLELVAAEGSALIAQYFQLGGEKKFPLNPSHSTFSNLDVLYIISSNQENWHKYWPRSIWEFRDGATVVFQFSQGLEASLEDANEIVSSLNPWMGTTLDVLYGVEIQGTTTLFYWGYMSAQNHTDFIYDEFYDVLSTGGYTNFITNEVIANAPVSVVGTGLVKNETGHWIPLAVSAFIKDDGITIDGDGVHEMSVNTAFGYTGTIRPASNSILSHIKFKLPYVANVYDLYPETNNLYPELTGHFDWTMKFGEWDTSYDDIYVIYDMAVDELQTFPQITGEQSIDVTELHSATDPKLNYTISMENTGDETAYNTTFVWDIGGKPDPMNITIFNAAEYKFNSTIEKYYDIVTGMFYNTYQGTGAKILITGWFTHLNDTIVQPVNMPIANTSYYMIDLAKSIAAVNINKSAFTFSHSDNLLTTTLENGNFALTATIDELEQGATEDFWWSIGDLPAEDDTFLIVGFDAVTNQTPTGDNIPQYNVTFIDNTTAQGVGNNLKDLIVLMALAEGSDLRYPPLDAEFIPGVMFRYADNSSREYFGWANGLVIQLYDDEAMLKTTVALNQSIYRIDDMAEISVTIENIGDANATNVAIQGYHALLGPDWVPRDVYNFTDVTWIGTIEPGKNKTHSFIREVKTFLGLHPVAIGVRYTTEESEGIDMAFNRTEVDNLVSNLIVSIVLPKDDKAGEDEPSYPTPEVNVSVTWKDDNGDYIEKGDLIEIRTEVTNTGDEATTIKLFSYFPNRMGHINIAGNYYEDNNNSNFKVTDGSGTIIPDDEYDEGFALDHPDWPINIAAVGGLHLAPGATIVFYYKLIVDEPSALIMPPVAVEYDSRYPMAGASGMEGASSGDEGEGPSPLSVTMSLKTSSAGKNLPRFKIQQDGDSGSSWSSHSSAAVLSTYAAVVIPTTTTEPSETTTNGVVPTTGFTTVISFIRDNMTLTLAVLAIPVVVLLTREYRLKRK
jgi:hypothetical protein